MACQINRTKDGKINEVTTPTGAKSKLFEAIHSNVFLADAETSVKVYNNAYSEKVEKMFEGATTNKYDTGEPQLFYKSPSNKVYDNLEEVLIFEELGEISMGFLNPKNEEFIPVAKFTNKGSTKNEFLAAKVREGLLSADRVLGVDGITRFQGKGEYTTTRKVTALFVETDLKNDTGNGRVKVLDDGTIEIEFAKDYSEAIDDNGNSTPIKTENIPEYLEQNPNTKNKVELITEYVLKYDNPRPLEKDTDKADTNTVTDLTELENSLMAFLKGIGFTTTSLESYKANYNTKHGEGRDISALADIANKVIAFRDGEISAEDLSEEVAHIAIEAYADQGSIITALANVHLTPEYAEFSEKYRNRYSNDKNKDGSKLTPIELEDKVRKEILGKLLKKELITRFSTQNRTNEDIYLIKKLKAIWDFFMNKLRVNAKPYHTELLDELNATIADSILDNNTDDFSTDLLNDNQNYFYSLMDKNGKAIHDELKKAKELIETLYNNYLQEPSPSLTSLQDMMDDMSDYKTVSGVNMVVGIAVEQIKILENAVKSSIKNDTRLSKTDVSRYEILKVNLIPSVNTLMSDLKKSTEGLDPITDKKLLDTINRLSISRAELVEKLAEVEPSINTDKVAWVDRMLMKILNHTSLTDEQKEKIRDGLDGGSRDISVLGKMFGLSSHSKNTALQLMHFSVMNISAKTNMKFLGRMNELLSDITLDGGLKHQVAIINRDANNKATYYVDSARDYAWADKVTNDKKLEILGRLLDKDPSEVEELLKTKLPQELVDETAFQDFNTEMDEFIQNEVRERRFKEKYYTDREERFDRAKVSDSTRKYLSTKNSRMNSRHKEGGHIKEDGTKDLSNQTEEEKRLDNDDKHSHKLAASPYDTIGNIKPGLVRVKVSELTAEQRASIPVSINDKFKGDVTVMEEGMTLDELSSKYPESRLALDIFNHNMEFMNELGENSKSNDPIKEFFKNIQDIEDKGGVPYEWLISNSTLLISSNFYEGMADGKSIDELTQRYIDELTDPKDRDSHQIIFDEVKELKRSRSELLKQNKKSYSTVEYDAKHMTIGVSTRVRELDTEIYNATRDLNIPYETYDELGEKTTSSELNEDYYKELAESSATEYEFALSHSPEHSKERTRGFAREAKDYINGRSSHIKPMYAEFIEKAIEGGLLDNKELSKDELLELLKGEYAKSNVASYYKRFTPIGYSKALDALKNGDISISKFLENKEQFIEEYPALEYMEFTPDYTWRAEITNEDNLNPNFKQKDISNQPRKLNDEFFKKYWSTEAEQEQAKKEYLDLQDEDLSLLTPTKNKEQYKYLLTTVNINKEIIENYNMTGKTNPYLRVQMKKSDFERALSLYKSKNKKGALKDWIADFAKSQIDEMEYGQQIEGSGITIKQIPKYYQQKVEDPELITENTLQASLTSLKASIKYKERLLAENDVKAIEHVIKEQNFKSNAGNSLRARIQKKGEVSNYYLKAQEMADYHLYGIRQNRKMITTIFGKEVDFTQIISRFTDYVRNVNLAYNPLVDLTSYTTGVYNNLIDTIAGDYYHKSSVAEASKRLPNLMRLYMSQEGSIRKTSELNHLLEWLNVFSEDERLEMSAYKRGTRVLANSFYLGSKVANLPVTPRNMLAILYDNKFHNGRFKSFNDFSRDMRTEFGKDISKTEINSRWKKNTDTFYSNLNIDPSKGISMGENFKAKFGEKAEEEFEFYHTTLTSKITQINQSVDSIVSNEDQTMAQRDALTNSFLMHRSWFIINMTRKFKGKHFNIATGQYEAGHYNDALSTLKKLFKNTKSSVLNKEDKKALREVLDEHEIRNLIRAGVDGIGIILLVALSNALMDNDDDDDSYLENLAQLIAMRTTNETQSQNAIGIFGTVKDMYKDPLVQLKMIGQTKDMILSPFTDDSDEKKQKIRDKFWRNHIFTRRRRQLNTIDEGVRIYMKYNKDQLWGVTSAQNMPDPVYL